MLVQLVDFEDCVYFKYGFHNIKFGLILCRSVSFISQNNSFTYVEIILI